MRKRDKDRQTKKQREREKIKRRLRYATDPEYRKAVKFQYDLYRRKNRKRINERSRIYRWSKRLNDSRWAARERRRNTAYMRKWRAAKANSVKGGRAGKRRGADGGG